MAIGLQRAPILYALLTSQPPASQLYAAVLLRWPPGVHFL